MIRLVGKWDRYWGFDHTVLDEFQTVKNVKQLRLGRITVAFIRREERENITQYFAWLSGKNQATGYPSEHAARSAVHRALQWPVRPPTKRRGCPHCFGEIALNKDGMLRGHFDKATGRYCIGSHKRGEVL